VLRYVVLGACCDPPNVRTADADADDGEDVAALQKDELVLRWANAVLTQTRAARELTNLSTDLQVRHAAEIGSFVC
jgi:hypothetical protein